MPEQFRLDTCLLTLHDPGRCCNSYNHTHSGESDFVRPSAQYAVLCGDEDSLIEHLVCAECAIQVRKDGGWWDDMPLLAMKDYQPREGYEEVTQ